MKNVKEKQNNKKLKIILATVRAMVIVLFVAFIVVVCLQRFSENKISFFNYRMFTVISGSMKPKYDIGDVLLSKKVDPSKIKIGDAVTYQGRSDGFAGKVITHEVIGVGKNSSGKYVFKTQGLANLVEDPAVLEDQLYGVVIYKSLILSAIYKIVATNIGFYIFIIIPMVFIIGSEIISTLLKKEEKRREELKDK